MRKLLCAVLFASVSVRVGAVSTLDQARMLTYLFEQFIVVVSEHCQGEDPNLDNRLYMAMESFRRKLRVDIEAGRTAGRELTTSRGKSFEQFARELASKSMNEAMRAPGAVNKAEACFVLGQEIASKAEWSIDDFLQSMYADFIRDVGNAQGYPCGWLRRRADGAVEKFVRGNLDFSEEKAFALALLLGEVNTVLRFIHNCESAQTQAGEFHVTALEDYGTPKEALRMIEKALFAVGPGREARLMAVVEELKNYRPKGSNDF